MSHELCLIAVVVTFNRLEELKSTIRKVLQEKCKALIVVDNGSDDGTREWLSELNDDRLDVILAKENLGGAGGFELGARRACEQYDPDWIVVMDDDARPIRGAFEEFLKIKNTNCAILASAVYYPDGNICGMNRPSYNPFWDFSTFLKTSLYALRGQGRQAFHIKNQDYLANDILNIDAASFVGMFISRDVMKTIGLPDGKLFIYGDDVAYSLRARKAGFKIGFAPTVCFEHACSTFKTNQTYRPLWKIYYNYRNGVYVYKMASGKLFPLIAPICLLKWLLKAREYGPDKKIYRQLLWMGIRDGFLGRHDLKHYTLVNLVDDMMAAQSTNEISSREI